MGITKSELVKYICVLKMYFCNFKMKITSKEEAVYLYNCAVQFEDNSPNREIDIVCYCEGSVCAPSLGGI